MLRQLSYKKSVLVICKISRLFPNTLSAEDKYSLLDRDNLRPRIHMLFSQKQRIFWNLFLHFLKASLSLEHFQKIDDTDS